MPKKNKDLIIIKIDKTKVKRGHLPHISGSGQHADRRYRRRRTCESKQKASIKDQLEE